MMSRKLWSSSDEQSNPFGMMVAVNRAGNMVAAPDKVIEKICTYVRGLGKTFYLVF